MKKVNAKLFALKHALIKVLTKSLEVDKNAIKEGAEITFKDYCKIQIVECTKETLDKSKVKAICEKYGIDINTLMTKTSYKRIDVDFVPVDTLNEVNDVLDTLEKYTEDKNTKRVASKVARVK